MGKEFLSIGETAHQYCHSLLGSHCKFHVDHKNLGFQHFKSERVRRWRATLEEFDYSFIYCPGKDNTIADMLSRYPMTSIDIICRNGKIVLGPSLFTDILAWYHVNLNHPGQDRTYKTLHTVFYVPNMEAKVRQYVSPVP